MAWQNLTLFFYHDNNAEQISGHVGNCRETATYDTSWLYLGKETTNTLAHSHYLDGV